MSADKWTRANRLTEVIRHEIVTTTVGSAPWRSKKALASHSETFKNLDDGDTIWEVWLTTRTGLDKEVIVQRLFTTEEGAKAAVDSMPVGTVFGGGVDFSMRFKDFCDGAPNAAGAERLLSWMFGVNDQEAVHFTCYEALSNAGVISEKTYQISQNVLDWLGEEHVEWMKAEFGENWSVVGELEYCVNHFPHSSLATLAAKLFFSQFITYDDFTAGYAD